MNQSETVQQLGAPVLPVRRTLAQVQDALAQPVRQTLEPVQDVQAQQVLPGALLQLVQQRQVPPPERARLRPPV